MTKEIVIDGILYEPVVRSEPIKIVVLKRGLVYVGHVKQGEQSITIRDARSVFQPWEMDFVCVARLGELVNGPLQQTNLGPSHEVRARWLDVIHVVEVSQDKWAKYFD